MSESYEALLQTLATELVRPERYLKPTQLGWGGEIAMAQVIELKPEQPAIVA